MQTSRIINLCILIAITATSLAATLAKSNPLTKRPPKKSSPVAQKEHVRDIKTEKEFHALWQKSRTDFRPLVIQFYAPWCDACKQMQQSFCKYAQQARTYAHVISINVENRDTALLVDMFNIQKLPTFVVIKTLEGVPQDNLAARLDAMVGKVPGSSKRAKAT